MKAKVFALTLLILALWFAPSYAASSTFIGAQIAACTREHISCLETEKNAQKDVIAACRDIECKIHETANLVALNKQCMDGWRDCYRAAHGMKPLR